MVKFLGVLLIIIAAWYVLGFLGRLFLPFIVNKISKKVMNNMTGNQNFEKERKKEGEVSIKDNRQHKGSKQEEKGEYIDYEEIE